MAYDLTNRALHPLSELVEASELPLADVIDANDLPRIFDALYYTEAEVYALGENIYINLQLAFAEEVALRPPGVEAISLVLGSGGSGWTSLPVELVVGPAMSLILHEAPVTLRVRRDLLQPMKTRTEPDHSKTSTEVDLGTVTLVIDMDGVQIYAQVNANLPLCMIGSTGVLIEAQNLRWFSPNDPEAPDTSGLMPINFSGVYIAGARVYLPDIDFLPPSIAFEECYIGTGGFTGVVIIDDTGDTLTWDAAQSQPKYSGGVAAGELFGFQCGLKKIEIGIVQSCLTQCSILGEVFIPYFDKRVGVDLKLDMNGNLRMGLAAPQAQNPAEAAELGSDGLLRLKLKDLLDATLDSFTFERNGEVVGVQVSGKLRPLVADLDWPEFEVKALSIDSQGRVQIDGGWLDLSETKPLDFYGFKIAISKLGFGADEINGETWNWIGLNGGINLVKGMPMGASVEGLRISWHPQKTPLYLADLASGTHPATSAHKEFAPRLTLNGVGVSLKVPNVFSFEGSVVFFDDPDRGIRGFRGDSAFRLEKPNFAIEGRLVIGRSREGYDFFYIYSSIDLPFGIPLGNTNAAIYGFQGLLAVNMEPNRKPDEAWFTGWYKRDPIGATNTAKWINQRGSLALGAGVSIGTSTDNGFSINTKSLLILVLPGPIIMLEGKGNLIKTRPDSKDVTAEGAFTALHVLDFRQKILLINLAVRYNLVKIIDIQGEAEAFLNLQNPKDWHLFLGQKEPEEKRIQARIVEIFNADTYFMLTPNELAQGGRFGYRGGPWHYGPLSARFELWASLDGTVSPRPQHLEATLRLYGQLELRAFGAGLDIIIDAGAAARGPTKWEVDVWLQGTLKINLIFWKYEKSVEIRKHWELPAIPDPIIVLLGMAAEHFKSDESWSIPYQLDLSGSTLPAPGAFELLPPDARPVITFNRPIFDDVGIGRGTLAPPAPDVIVPGEYEFAYHLGSLELLKQVNGVWQPVAVAAHIKQVPSPGKIELFHAPYNAPSFVGGELIFGEKHYVIRSVSSSGAIFELESANMASASGPCQLIVKAKPLTGNIAAGSVTNRQDGTSLIVLDMTSLARNAYAGGTLRAGGQTFRVIGNEAGTVHVLNNSAAGAAQEIAPAPGAYELTALPGSELYGQWAPDGGEKPEVTTKLQLWSKTPYTYYRRNDPSIIPPVGFDLCGPAVSEEMICLTMDDLRDWEGQLVNLGPLVAGQDYYLDELRLTPAYRQPEGSITLERESGQQRIVLRHASEEPSADTPRLTFGFEPPLDRITVWGQGSLMATVNGSGAIPFPIDGSSPLDWDGPIGTLTIDVPATQAGSISKICFLPGWTRVNIPRDALPDKETPPHRTMAEVAGIQMERINYTPVALYELDTGIDRLIRFAEEYPDYYGAYLDPATRLRDHVATIRAMLPPTPAQVVSAQELAMAILEITSQLERPSDPDIPWNAVGIASYYVQSGRRLLTEPGDIKLSLPQSVTRGHLVFRARQESDATVQAYGGAVQTESRNLRINTPWMRVTLNVVGQSEGWIDRIALNGLDLILEEFWYDRPVFAWQRKQNLERRQHWQRQLEYWYQADTVLEPEQPYCLRLVTKTVNNQSATDDYPTQYWHGFFKVGSPSMGETPGASGYPQAGRLAMLGAYVRRTAPEDGAGERGLRPVYRSYDVGVEFNENYVDRLYLQAKAPLQMRILDNNGQPVAALANYWGQSPELRLSAGEQVWAAAVSLNQSNPCATVDWSKVAGDTTLLASGKALNLQPATLHRAELVARDVANAEHVLHSFAFTTSQFLSFAGHMHSFEDRLWVLPVQAITATDFTAAWNTIRQKLSDLGIPQRRATLQQTAERLRDPGADLKPEDFQAYEAALQTANNVWTELETTAVKLFTDLSAKLALPTQSLPKAVEIALLQGANGPHALLLTSPEPLDWRRLKLKVGHSTHTPVGSSLPPAALGSPIKISAASLPALPGRPTYWVSLFARQPIDLSGYKLEVAEDSSEPVFERYFDFPSGTIIEEGWQLAIYSSSPTSPSDNNTDVLVQDLALLQSGELSGLPEKIAWLRLLDMTGQIVQQRVFQTNEYFQAPEGTQVDFELALAGANGTRQMLALPNGDGTQALLLLKEGENVAIPAGSYLLMLEFQRDLGREVPVLRAAGRAASEIVQLEFLVP